MIGLLLICLGILLLIHNHSIKKYPIICGEIVDVSSKPFSYGKYGTRNPFIVRVFINNQPVIISTLSTVNSFWGMKSAIEFNKKAYVGKKVHVYFNHKCPGKSVIKEFQNKKNIVACIILFVVGIMSIFSELIVALTIIYSFLGYV